MAAACFPKTREGLDQVYKLLRCVKCHELPKEKVFMLGNCEHKYCESCVVGVAGKACLICDRLSMAKEAVPDLFSTSFLSGIRVLEKALENEIAERLKKQGEGESPPPPPPANASGPKMTEGLPGGPSKDGKLDNYPGSSSHSAASKKTMEHGPPAGDKLFGNSSSINNTSRDCRRPLIRRRRDDVDDDDDDDSGHDDVDELLSLESMIEGKAPRATKELNKAAAGSTSPLKEKNKPEKMICLSKLKRRISQIVSSNDEEVEDDDGKKKKKKRDKKGTKDGQGDEKQQSKSIGKNNMNTKKSKAGNVATTASPKKDETSRQYDSDADMFEDCYSHPEKAESPCPPLLTPHVKKFADEKETARSDDDDDDFKQKRKFTNKSSKKDSDIIAKVGKKASKDSPAVGGKKNLVSDRSPQPPPLTPYGKKEKNGGSAKPPTGPRRSKRSKDVDVEEPLKAACSSDMDTPKRTVNKSKSSAIQPGMKSPDITENIPTAAARTRVRGRTSSGTSSSSTTPSGANASFSSNCAVDKRNSKGETQLHVACRSGQMDKVKQLMEMGADLNAQDYAGWTPLHEAINGKGKNKLELVTYLCEHGCNTNIPGMDNEFALHEAARNGLEEIVKCLLSHSASPNVRNKLGKLPRDVTSNESIKELMNNASAQPFEGKDEALNSSTDDPVVLKLQFSKSLLYFCNDLTSEELESVKALGLKVSSGLRSEVTHLIFPSGESKKGKGNETGERKKVLDYSLEYLHGITNGAWMLRKEWIDECIAKKELLSPKNYEVQGCFDSKDAPTKARLNKEIGNPGLLNGMTFYLYKSCSYESISKKELVKLIISAEGAVINREPNPDSVDPLESPIRFHAKENNHKLVLTSHVILYGNKDVPPEDKKYNMEHIKTLKVNWLIESIGNFSLLNPDGYL